MIGMIKKCASCGEILDYVEQGIRVCLNRDCQGYTDSRGFTGFFACNCSEHAYHSNCKGCGCRMNERSNH